MVLQARPFPRVLGCTADLRQLNLLSVVMAEQASLGVQIGSLSFTLPRSCRRTSWVF